MNILWIVMRTGPEPGQQTATKFNPPTGNFAPGPSIQSTQSWWFESQTDAYEFANEKIRQGTRCHYSIHECAKGERRE